MPPLSDYLDSDADQLSDRVDFSGMIGDTGRAMAIAVFSAVSGVILSIRRGFEDVFSSLEASFELVFLEYASTVPGSMQAAIETAIGDLPQFEFLSGAVGVFVLVATAVGVLFVLNVFWGELL